MIVVVTGTSRGIGRGVAEHLAAQGHQVVGCSRGRAPWSAERYLHVEVDLTSPRGAMELFHLVRKEFGQLDALVNNAGTSVMNHFMLMSDEANRSLFETNVVSLIACAREAAKLLMKSPYEAPSILSFSTIAVPWALEGQLAYSASKAAAEQMTRVLSRELGRQGVRANALGLPPVRTALTRTVAKEKIDALIQRQAIARQCEIADLLGPVEFLLSPAARFVTGETLYLGGVH